MGAQFHQTKTIEERNALGSLDINGHVKKNQFGAVIRAPDALTNGMVAGQKTFKQKEIES